MTAPSSWFKHRPKRSFELSAPLMSAEEISIVIPIKDNQAGLDKLIQSINSLTRQPLEIIIVDNNSSKPVQINLNTRVPVSVITCKTPGAAAARNAGAKTATGRWIWFLDSDCEVKKDTLCKFCSTKPGPIAFNGRIVSSSSKLLGRYYETQEILLPQFAEDNEPLYLITASAIIFKPALEVAGYFDERFPSAAGEDIDLGLRLFAMGKLAFAEEAEVLHSFEECIDSFRKRFRRYGAGNKVLAEKHGISLMPSPFTPNSSTHFSKTLARIQYEELLGGYCATNG